MYISPATPLDTIPMSARPSSPSPRPAETRARTRTGVRRHPVTGRASSDLLSRPAS